MSVVHARLSAAALLIVTLVALPQVDAQAGLLASSQADPEPHAPISIIGELYLGSMDCVRSGSGTISDPYVIASWEIEAGRDETCIHIQSVDCHIEIRDVYLHGSRNGIYLTRASNVVVRESVVSDNHNGVAMVDCHDCSVVDNAFDGNDYAVWLWSSKDIVIEGNTYLGNEYEINEQLGLDGLDSTGWLVLTLASAVLGLTTLVSWRMAWFSRGRHRLFRMTTRLLAVSTVAVITVLVVLGLLLDMHSSGTLTAASYVVVAFLAVLSGIAASITIALAGSRWVEDETA